MNKTLERSNHLTNIANLISQFSNVDVTPFFWDLLNCLWLLLIPSVYCQDILRLIYFILNISVKQNYGLLQLSLYLWFLENETCTMLTFFKLVILVCIKPQPILGIQSSGRFCLAINDLDLRKVSHFPWK